MTERSKATFTMMLNGGDTTLDAEAMAKQLRDNIPTGVTSRGDVAAFREGVEWHGRRLSISTAWDRATLNRCMNDFIDEIVIAAAAEDEEDAERKRRRARANAERDAEMRADIEAMIPLVCSTAAAVRKDLINKQGWSPGNGDVAVLTALAMMGAMRMR